VSDEVIISLISVVGTVIVALLGKISFDLGHAKRDARAVHESINNRADEHGRPIPLSDRLDDVFRMAERAEATAQTAARHAQGARQDVNELFASDREQRRDILTLQEGITETQRQLADHLTASTPIWNTVKKLSEGLLGKEKETNDSL
jgi:hypothetical protein